MKLWLILVLLMLTACGENPIPNDLEPAISLLDGHCGDLIQLHNDLPAAPLDRELGGYSSDLNEYLLELTKKQEYTTEDGRIITFHVYQKGCIDRKIVVYKYISRWSFNFILKGVL